MKNLSYLIMISAAVFAFQACNSSNDAKETADSMNEVKEDSTGTMAVEGDDAEFATEAANYGIAEVNLGKLALEKTTNADVKSYAQMMVSDHGKANEELMTIAGIKNITLPGTVDDEHKKKMEDLSKKFGKDFDKAYVDAMVDGHQKTLDLMKDEINDGKDADLKIFASKMAPVVQTHLDAIKKIQSSL